MKKEENKSDSVVKTEVVLSDDSVQKVLSVEVVRILTENENMVSELIRSVLFHKKDRGYGRESHTFLAECIQEAIKPILKEEIEKQLVVKRNRIAKEISKALAGDSADENALVVAMGRSLSDALSKLDFYVSR